MNKKIVHILVVLITSILVYTWTANTEEFEECINTNKDAVVYARKILFTDSEDESGDILFGARQEMKGEYRGGNLIFIPLEDAKSFHQPVILKFKNTYNLGPEQINYSITEEDITWMKEYDKKH